MRKTKRAGLFGLSIASLIALFALPAAAQQASLNLQGGGAQLSHYQITGWDLTKSAVLNNSAVTWTVGATKGGLTHAFITASGFITVTNGGSANATIGNIVINLQKKSKNTPKVPFVSVAADMANSSSGDSATSAKICAQGSQEDPAANLTQGCGNYTTLGNQGTFIKTAGSGKVEFTDAGNNNIFSLTPQLVLAPAQSITLLYAAQFDNTVLGLAPGADLRVEALVTFGNAGARGGSGASCPNVDISGNGLLEADEANVRTVPVRVSTTLPFASTIDSQATLTDTAADIATGGTVTFSGFSTNIGAGAGSELLTASATRTVTGTVDAGARGGIVTNTAHLTTSPIYATLGGYSFLLSSGVSLNASASVEIAPPAEIITAGSYCTFRQRDWGHNHVVPPSPTDFTAVLLANFSSVYPTAPLGTLEIGVPGTPGLSLKFTSGPALVAFLPQNGDAAPLDFEFTNPVATHSRSLGGDTVALRLNIDFNEAHLMPAPYSVKYLKIANLTTADTLDTLGVLHLTQAQCDAINGQTYAQVYDQACKMLGTPASLGGYHAYAGLSYDQMKDLCDKLNESFQNCTISSWCAAHIVK